MSDSVGYNKRLWLLYRNYQEKAARVNSGGREQAISELYEDEVLEDTLPGLNSPVYHLANLDRRQIFT